MPSAHPLPLAQFHTPLHHFLGGGLLPSFQLALPTLPSGAGTENPSLDWCLCAALHCEVFMDSDPHQPGPHLALGGVRLHARCLCEGRDWSCCRSCLQRPPEGQGHP